MATTGKHRPHPIGLNRIRFQWDGEHRVRCYRIEAGEPIWIDCPPKFDGLGDLVAGAAKAVGVTPSKGCGCEKRRQALNRATPNWLASVLSKLKNFVTRPPK